ncbi:DUF2442 domain-containing protein [Dialister sp.]|uniref:DUF2442 domain-containing protein n=1 Tax=Dialister sp. TaxID=1955814 RepID=UPI002E823E9B|nr:DUF2442 domain-containing protein [Dialister sp.]MEE3453777.1 DUF2442 domain-containing protein [Dialister sp.]
MYIVDDICYAGSPEEGLKVKAVKALRGGILLVTFSTGEERLLDTTELKGSAFKALENEDVVSHPALFHGVITWNNGEIDIAPEAAYEKSYPYTAPDYRAYPEISPEKKVVSEK